MIKRLTGISGFTLVLSLAISAQAQAQVIVHGNSEARACYMAAKTDDAGRRASIKRCETALDDEFLNRKDKTATQVNMGILLMRSGGHESALAAYDRAIELQPELAEAHINRGACLIHLSRPEDAIAALSKSIDLGTKHLPDALYNRAIAYERLGDIKPAYKDFKRAADLRPEWTAPSRALERYQVVSKRAN